MKALSRRSGPLLFLTELLVSILVLAAAAVLCVSLFAHARSLRQKSASLDRAVVLAENAAEAFKAQGNALEVLLSGAEAGDSSYSLGYDEKGLPCDLKNASYVLRLGISKENGLAEGDISVFDGAGDELYSLNAAALAEVSP
ncbi:MAG TPA: hypothetical protein VN512_05705 [Clostridia bacterium]|nr:hypothetical protein [Clostridia bacterium]